MSLPQPRNATETYLAAINDRLGQILDRLPARTQEPDDGQVELREPATPNPHSDKPAELAEPSPRASRRRTKKTGGA